MAEIAKTRVKADDPDATLCEWEKPGPAAHDTNGRRWLAEYGAVEEINAHRYPRIFKPDPRYRSRGFGHERIMQVVYKWLRQHVGLSDVRYSFSNLMFGTPENTTTRTFIGFRSPQDIFAFRMA